MLEDARLARNSIAWLRDTHRAVHAKVQKLSSTPQPGALNFFAPDFALNTATPWLVGEPLASLELTEGHPLPAVVHGVEPESAAFARMHEAILHRIHGGEFEKVVPIVIEELEFAARVEPAMFPRLFATPPEHQFSYGFAFEDEGLCGLTPELLFAVDGEDLHTMALAGTGKADGPSLLEDSKERREHEIVVEHISAELKDWGELDVGVTQERQFGALKHLYTPLHLRLNRQPEFMELVVRLHPTAALGGWPRRPAVEWLQAQDFHVQRRRFGAPFGYQAENGRMECVVAIRALQWCGPRAWLMAGCGVVEGSQALREWNELRLKRDAIRSNLGINR